MEDTFPRHNKDSRLEVNPKPSVVFSKPSLPDPDRHTLRDVVACLLQGSK